MNMFWKIETKHYLCLQFLFVYTLSIMDKFIIDKDSYYD